mmetsp:Transcript_44267/g.99603  ORF Transcript_44267/g.99603 Transcript_44267/m.99603 type:complete len:109 (-) Transcript_44267:82-408(-)
MISQCGGAPILFRAASAADGGAASSLTSSADARVPMQCDLLRLPRFAQLPSPPIARTDNEAQPFLPHDALPSLVHSDWTDSRVLWATNVESATACGRNSKMCCMGMEL